MLMQSVFRQWDFNEMNEKTELLGRKPFQMKLLPRENVFFRRFFVYYFPVHLPVRYFTLKDIKWRSPQDSRHLIFHTIAHLAWKQGFSPNAQLVASGQRMDCILDDGVVLGGLGAISHPCWKTSEKSTSAHMWKRPFSVVSDQMHQQIGSVCFSCSSTTLSVNLLQLQRR